MIAFDCVENVRGHFNSLTVFEADCISTTVFLYFEVNYSDGILCLTQTHICNGDKIMPLCPYLLKGSKILSLWWKKYNTIKAEAEFNITHPRWLRFYRFMQFICSLIIQRTNKNNCWLWHCIHCKHKCKWNANDTASTSECQPRFYFILLDGFRVYGLQWHINIHIKVASLTVLQYKADLRNWKVGKAKLKFQ